MRGRGRGYCASTTRIRSTPGCGVTGLPGGPGWWCGRGVGAKPFFFPRSSEVAREELEQYLHQSARQHHRHQTRWRLAVLQAVIPWLQQCSVPGLQRVLRRLGFSRKQARTFGPSPDPAYDAKWRAILRAYQAAVEQAQRVVLVFLDELTYYRRPQKAPAYHRQGHTQPQAPDSPRANTKTRLVAALNAITARTLSLQRSTIGRHALCAFYADRRAAYPDAETLYVVQDNWPVHRHPEVLAALAQHRLTPLFLPTYASWLNPIEKLWRWLRQEVLHLHPWADDLSQLRTHVLEFLDQFAHDSPALLRYVGLADLPN